MIKVKWLCEAMLSATSWVLDFFLESSGFIIILGTFSLRFCYFVHFRFQRAVLPLKLSWICNYPGWQWRKFTSYQDMLLSSAYWQSNSQLIIFFFLISEIGVASRPVHVCDWWNELNMINTFVWMLSQTTDHMSDSRSWKKILGMLKLLHSKGAWVFVCF